MKLSIKNSKFNTFNKKLNKKGFSMISESDKMLFWFIIMGVIMLCMILIIAWTSNLKKMYMDDSLAPAAYEARLIYSDKCFAYKDPVTERVYTGTIDSAKFNEQVLYDCLPLDGMSNHAISATLQTKDDKNNEFGKTIESANWNMKTDTIMMRSYVVQVKGYSSGILTFYHKSGD